MDVYSLEPSEDEISKFMLDDLQLAAELGKTLLERNRELENELKQHQSTIDDQAQEIEYLQKSKTALEEVNQARLNFYEKLEDGISKMERDHQQLIIENNNEKKSNKTLKRNVEQLESKIEELHKNLAEAQKNFIAEKRKNERLEKERNSEENCVMKVNFRKMETPINESLHDDIDGYLANQTADSCNFAFQSPRNPKANSTGISFNGLNGTYQETDGEADEEILRVVGDLEKALQSEKERVNELEDQLGEMIVENKTLQGRIAQTSTNEHYKSVHDELSSLDEVRQGQMCSRCLRQVQDQYGYDETLSIAPTEDDDDLVDSASAINASRSEHIAPAPIKESRKSPPNSLSIEGEDIHEDAPNPYKDLVDKYEALLEVQRQSNPRRRSSVVVAANSLAEEMKAAKACEQMEKQHEKEERVCGRDALSEAETSSSGYSDETSTKGTQTDGTPGYFLCSIGNSDGDEDCKFSIYDDSSQSIYPRFRNRPEYRELFKEIFAVLKKAADNKAEGDKLPLLDDEEEAEKVVSVPPVTPAAENMPEPSEIDCDSQSIISSAVSEQSFAMSECITKLERKTAKKQHAAVVASQSTQQLTDGRVMVPLKREPLDYLTAGLGHKKRNRNRKNRVWNPESRSESPSGTPSSPRQGSTKKRKDYRPFDFQSTPSPLATPPNRQPPSANQEWDGSSLIIYNRRNHSQAPGSTPRTSQSGEVDLNAVQYRPSTLFQDFHKLKKLDMSYAEVLRKAADDNQHHNYYQYQYQMQQAAAAGLGGFGHSQGHKKSHRSNNFYQQQRQKSNRH
ncbi:CDR2L family protein [Megaselia abdita]